MSSARIAARNSAAVAVARRTAVRSRERASATCTRQAELQAEHPGAVPLPHRRVRLSPARSTGGTYRQREPRTPCPSDLRTVARAREPPAGPRLVGHAHRDPRATHSPTRSPSHRSFAWNRRQNAGAGSSEGIPSGPPRRLATLEQRPDKRASVADGLNRNLNLSVALDSFQHLLHPRDGHRPPGWTSPARTRADSPAIARIRFSRPVTVRNGAARPQLSTSDSL